MEKERDLFSQPDSSKTGPERVEVANANITFTPRQEDAYSDVAVYLNDGSMCDGLVDRSTGKILELGVGSYGSHSKEFESEILKEAAIALSSHMTPEGGGDGITNYMNVEEVPELEKPAQEPGSKAPKNAHKPFTPIELDALRVSKQRGGDPED